MPSIPPFSALPLRKDGPHGNAWGLFGATDQLGMLNRLTPQNTTAAARDEIRDGTRIPVDLQLGHLATPCFGRAPLEHKMWQKSPRIVHDDALTFNTQSSSQWDGFRHYGYQKEQLFFNGRSLGSLSETDELGMQSWVDNGGIVGRGVLLDYAAWADAKGLNPAIFSPTSIPVGTLKEIAAYQNTTLRENDILFVRSGYIRAYDKLTQDERQGLADMKAPPAIGLESSEETLRWIWETGFSALVGDHPSMEAWPCQDERFWLHEWCLAGWGLPLGELFDLERLGEECGKRKRWSFFFTSMPLKVHGGVASPPNGIAIF